MPEPTSKRKTRFLLIGMKFFHRNTLKRAGPVARMKVASITAKYIIIVKKMSQCQH